MWVVAGVACAAPRDVAAHSTVLSSPAAAALRCAGYRDFQQVAAVLLPALI